MISKKYAMPLTDRAIRMTKWRKFDAAKLCIGIAFIATVIVGTLAMHRRSLEHVTGHPVSLWDAYWTR